MKYCLDTSALIDMWNDFYPIEVFPTLYEKLKGIIEQNVIIKPVYQEIKDGPLCDYLKDTGLQITPVTGIHEKEALFLEEKYETQPDPTKGANTTDIKLIAFAKIEGHIIVTSESKQLQQPDKISNYKMPLICKEENISCINFVDFLKKNNIKI